MLGHLVAGAGAAAACAAGYQTMSPTGQWYGRTFVGLKPGSRMLALTYDDGPNDPHTLRLLDVLARHNVKATFFLIGRYVKQRPDIARDVVSAGHVIGNHTYSHPNLIFASDRGTRRQVQDCQETLRDALGIEAKLFRPPFGGRRPGTLQIVRTLNLVPIMWRAAGYDWRGKTAEYVERKVSAGLRGGDVILLHDGGHATIGADRSQTVIATDHLIARHRSQGYEFMTVNDMLAMPTPAAASVVRY